MKKYYAAVWMIVVALALVTPLAAAAEEKELTAMEKYYGSLVDEAIIHCEAKNKMRASWSGSVRRTAAVAYLKGAYLKEYKNDLVHDMIEEEVGEKPFKVNYYLNKRFYRLFNREPAYIVRR
jgi:hypothetical protein